MLKHKLHASGIIFATIIGGIIGFAISAVAATATVLFAIPGLRSILAASPFPAIVTTTVLGMVIGGFIGALPLYSQNSSEAGQNTDYLTDDKIDNKVKIKLREEQLDITKNRVKTADVDVHKEIVTDKKKVTVPVAREELVVEEKAIGNNQESKTARIPLSEESIEVIKHPKQLNDVNISKKEHTENETVEETLKKEKLTTESKGDVKTKTRDK